MKLGIFTPEIAAANPAQLFQKVQNYGFSQVQFDFLSCCSEETPHEIPYALIAELQAQAAQNNIEFFVLNGTYNMAHPDKAVRDYGVECFFEICRAARALHCPVVSLCTGTRTRESMWVPHPDNNSAEAWKDMCVSIEKAIEAAEKYDVLLGIETEASNVCNSPEKVLRLIREMQSDRLKVIMDCANLFNVGTAYRSIARDIIRKGFDLLGEYVEVAHAKDIKESAGIDFTYTGNGIVDFCFFLEELKKIGYSRGVIIHGTKHEDEIPKAINHLNDLMK